MSFALQMHNVPRIKSWPEAAALLERAMERKPLMNGGYLIPGKTGNRDISMRMSNEGIHFRYHTTDVITWHPDGSYTYDPWTSRSTCAFFNQFCPENTYLTRDGVVLIIDDTGYAVCGGDPVHVVGGVPQSGIGVFTREAVDREAAKKVLERTRYAEYREWYKIMSPLLTIGEHYLREEDAVEMLKDEKNWPELASARWGQGNPNTIRTTIYLRNNTECYRTEVYKTLPRDKATRSAYRVMRSA